VDETTLSLNPLLRACWMKIGIQRRIPVTQPGTKQKQHIWWIQLDERSDHLDKG
jgi:hypothetical protein